MSSISADVAVIGAGLAGLTCARTLAEAGVPVTVFEKSRGPGGRSSTRHSAEGDFDHGAPFVFARAQGFVDFLADCAAAGAVKPWSPRIRTFDAGAETPIHGPDSVYVGTPGMSALAGHLARDLDLHTGHRVLGLEPDVDQWRLSVAPGRSVGPFRQVVVAVPAPQAVPLLAPAPTLAESAAQVSMTSTWTAMITLTTPVAAELDIAYFSHPVLSMAIRDASKPARHGNDTWVLHASQLWTRDHLEATPEWAASALSRAFASQLALPGLDGATVVGHRWRYALAVTPLSRGFLLDPELGLAACGDWCRGARLEDAFLSGLELATELLPALGLPR